MHRKTILTQALTLTTKDRNEAYGPPYQNLTNIAALWNTYLSQRYQTAPDLLSPEDIAWMNVLTKIGRSFSPAPLLDNYIDAAAYAAIAGECREPEQFSFDLETEE